MAIHVIVDDTSHIIVNRIVVEDGGQWKSSAGQTVVEETDNPMAIGGTYLDGVYTPPPEPPSPFAETR